MPTSGEFTALTTLGERVTYAIDVLDDAMSDADGNLDWRMDSSCTVSI